MWSHAQAHTLDLDGLLQEMMRNEQFAKVRIDIRHPKSREILMFVCLQKDTRQCCDAIKLDCTHCDVNDQQTIPIDLCDITALSGVFLEEHKIQNLVRLR